MESINGSPSDMDQSGIVDSPNTETAVRYEGKWYKITPKQYEPERQTYAIAWLSIKKGLTSRQAYVEWYSLERNNAKLLYPLFRKDE